MACRFELIFIAYSWLRKFPCRPFQSAEIHCLSASIKREAGAGKLGFAPLPQSFCLKSDHLHPSNWPFSPIKMTSLRRNVQSEYWIGHTRFFLHLSVRDCAREDLWKSTQHLSTLPYTHWQDIGVGIRACLPQFFFAPRSIFLPPMPFATTKRTFHETYVTL